MDAPRQETRFNTACYARELENSKLVEACSFWADKNTTILLLTWQKPNTWIHIHVRSMWAGDLRIDRTTSGGWQVSLIVIIPLFPFRERTAHADLRHLISSFLHPFKREW